MIARSFTIEPAANQLLFGLEIVKELKRAGVPVLGDLWPQGTEFGKLTVESDPLAGELTYTWTE